MSTCSPKMTTMLSSLLEYLLYGCLGVLAAMLFFFVCQDAVTRSRARDWYGSPPNHRGHWRLWRNQANHHDTTLYLARVVIDESPTVFQLSPKEKRVMMKAACDTVDTALRKAAEEYGLGASTAAAWVRLHGLNSLGYHLAAGYTGSELATFVSELRLPDEKTTEFMLAMRHTPDDRAPQEYWSPIRENVEQYVPVIIDRRYAIPGHRQQERCSQCDAVHR